MSPMSEPRYPRPPQRTSPVIWFLAVLLLVLLALGGWFAHDFWKRLETPSPAEMSRPMRTVTLYFAAADGSGLVAEGRRIVDCPVEQDCYAATLQALIDGPTGSLAPVIPAKTSLRGIALDADGVLQADFGKELADRHPGGSWSELLTVQALANTLAANFPQLRQVRILIDGAAVETLKGHVDLRQPITPDYSLVLRAPAAEPPTTPTGRPQ